MLRLSTEKQRRYICENSHFSSAYIVLQFKENVYK